MKRITRIPLVLAALALAACGQTPESTERARGVAGTGEANIVLVLSVVFVVVSVGLIVGAIGLDRIMQARKALQDLPESGTEPEQDEEDEVAGIGQGTGGVPRWLYAFYVLIPVWALVFVFTNVDITGGNAEEPVESPAATETPSGPVTEQTILALNIQFDLDELGPFPAETEITVEFDNQDAGIPHNVAVYESEATAPGSAIFVGDIFNGNASRDYTFTTPAAGEYFFRCDVHPAMKGAFVVAAA